MMFYSMIQFNNDSLNPTKAHGVDNISIWMIQLCGDSIKIPLTLVLNFFSWAMYFLWHMENCKHKSGSWKRVEEFSEELQSNKSFAKSLVKNCRAISLLPIFGKIFERLLFTFLFFHFNSNNPFNKFQSSFMPGDSIISQLIFLVLEIQSLFGCNPYRKSFIKCDIKAYYL